MKIRLWGTWDECREAAERLMHTPGLIVLSVSEPRADRGASVLVRVYVEARPDPPEQHATATTEPRPCRPDERASALAQRMTGDKRHRPSPPGGGSDAG
jgi:hypothetical protein